MNTSQDATPPVGDLPHFVDGARIEGASQRWGEVFDPASGAVTARVPLASRAETERAIAAAAAAFPKWAGTPPLRRARIMFKFKELIERHADELSALISQEHGKVLSDAKGEIQRG
ncbi:MAG: aldehyde dehydrogenase family protein, partial [Sterolibacterium sp.]